MKLVNTHKGEKIFAVDRSEFNANLELDPLEPRNQARDESPLISTDSQKLAQYRAFQARNKRRKHV